MDAKRLIEAINKVEDLRPRAYSGRFMYGKQCVAFSCDDADTAIADILEANEDSDDYEKLDETLHTYSCESLGLRVIVYYSSIEWPND